MNAEFGKILIIFGMIAVALGVVFLFSGQLPWIGKLPGDFYVRRGNFSFYFPLATCLLVSLVLTVLFHIFRR